MRKIKLMADYGCFPLWEDSPDAVGNIDPDTLPISDELKLRLDGWATQYDETLDPEDPLESGFDTKADEQRFEEKGKVILQELQNELGPDFQVVLQV